MKAVAQPFRDARTWSGGERRSVLVQFDDAAVMFTASWDRPSSLVPRPDGAYRRKCLVSLLLTPQYRERSFHQVRAVSLCMPADDEVLTTDDVGDVYSRDLHSVTLAVYVDDWQPREHGSGIVTKPWRNRMSS